MKKKNKRGKLIFISIILIFSILLIISTVSAGFSDWFKKIITGKGIGPQPQNMTISVVGISPVEIIYVSVPDTNAVELTTITVNFEVHMYDVDGVSDLDDESVFANFTKAGETPKSSAMCLWQNDLGDGYTANYSCSIDMFYWDSGGTWNVGVRGVDRGNQTYQHNTTETFEYSTTRAMMIYPNPLIWPAIIPGVTDQKATTPLTINNTGNYNGITEITALDLLGEDLIEAINASEFNISIADDCLGTTLVNDSSEPIAGSNSNPGNLLAGGGEGQEELYYCIPLAPLVKTQEYSTDYGGDWLITYP